MKKHNFLIALSLSAAFFSCEDKKKSEENTFSIDSSQLKQVYHTNDALKLSISNKNNAPIDSVAYYLNDKKIGASKENQVLNFPLENEKLGGMTIKAIIYQGATPIETTSHIELASSVVPKILQYKIINTYPHDIKAYTQGLEFLDDILIESTGNGAGNGTGKKGISSIRKVDYKTGKVLKIVELPETVFGEGATVLNNKIYQLTYKNNEAYVYNAETLVREQTIPYFAKMEGWGLTNDGTNLYMSNGSERVYIIDPKTFKELDYINIYTNNVKIGAINEMEWVDGKIYANIYGERAIAIINPKNGTVEAAVDLSELQTQVTYHPDLDVLNGIAYNPKTKTFFVTGKNWDKMFEIEIIQN
ncbi:glutaminyl-peptide cyclotransferase [Flavobacterium sp. NKUCC04_CG]|uniref:glutaminyl-peptide cyclotransferase n=1 Tax=Flavobacterium sp. NKUCC04_CG TaxID=2842121 RepID=UPI001C5B5823|nr:glutaminyl-peptide cyclotransferase [Flavobacterium sp. NKUCC04_CG]MBW3519747.1 glutaminyl-peptide cyclotransferase [Flavobacterium sp. NKUCC04_CG]